MLTSIFRNMRTRGGFGSFWRDHAGVSAVEFALVAPVLAMMLVGATELSSAITAGNRATYVAEAIAQMVSQAKGPVSQEDMTSFIKSAALIDPDIATYARVAGKANLESAANVAVSSIVFTPKDASCTLDCTFDAHVVFSESLAGSPKRSCGTLMPGNSGLGSLPARIFSPNSLVVVDVETFYRPLMRWFLPMEISFKRTVYLHPRNVEHVNYRFNCPGFPVT